MELQRFVPNCNSPNSATCLIVDGTEENGRRITLPTWWLYLLCSINIVIIRKMFCVCGSLSPRHGASSGCGWRNGLRYGGQLRINRISSRGQPTRGGPPAWGLGEALTTPLREKKKNCSEILVGEMLPLETKQSGGKILPYADLRGGGVFLEEASRNCGRL